MSTKKKLNCSTLGCKMAYAVKGIFRSLQQRFAEHDINLTIEQFFILNILDKEDRLILQELADIVDRDKSAVLRHIDSLEKQHYVVRSQDADDRRRKILLLTKKGATIFKKASDLEEQVNSDLTKHIPSEKLNEYHENIDKIYENAMQLIH